MRKKLTILVFLDAPRSKYLTKMLQSLQSQTLAPEEVLFFTTRALTPDLIQLTQGIGELIHIQAGQGTLRVLNQRLPTFLGDVVMEVGQEDVLAPNALDEVSLAFEADANLKVVYSNETRVSDWDQATGRTTTKMLPNALLLRHQNQMGRASACLTSAISTFPMNVERDLWHGIHLQIMDNFGLGAFQLLPAVLYSIREPFRQLSQDRRDRHYMVPFDTYAIGASLARAQLTATVRNLHGTAEITYSRTERPTVELVLHSCDQADVINTCLQAIGDLRLYPNLSITLLMPPGLVFQNQSRLAVREVSAPDLVTALNHLVQITNATYLVFLDAYARPISHDWIEEMMFLSMQAAAGIVGPRLISEQNRLLCGGLGVKEGEIITPYKGWPWDTRGNLNTQLTPHHVTSVSDQCFLLSSRLLNTLGGFAPEMPQSLALELCIKSQELGLNNVYCPQATLQMDAVEFPVGLSPSEASYFWTKFPSLVDKYYSTEFLSGLPVL